jgi:hypothetical protein
VQQVQQLYAVPSTLSYQLASPQQLNYGSSNLVPLNLETACHSCNQAFLVAPPVHAPPLLLRQERLMCH